MKLSQFWLSLFLILFVNLCLGQPVIQLSNDLKLTAKVISTNSDHFIILNLKMFSDTQNIQIHREISYGNEIDPIVDCRFVLKKIIKNQSVNMYVMRPYYPDLNSYELRKFTTKDSLTDTIRIEDFINLEPGPYTVYLSLRYYKNSVENTVYSDEVGFFVKPQQPGNPARKKKI